MNTTIATIRTAALLACLLLGASARPASAQEFGGRLGVSGGPTQFYLGPHAEFGPVVPQLWFRPNIEAGFGDGGQLYGFNVEFAYRIPLTGNLKNAPWQPYVVAGPAMVVTHSDGFGTNTGGGFNIGMGLEHANGLFAEIKAGVGDSPDFKFSVGYNFKK